MIRWVVITAGMMLHWFFLFALASQSPAGADPDWWLFIAVLCVGSGGESMLTTRGQREHMGMPACNFSLSQGTETVVAQITGLLILLGIVAAHVERGIPVGGQLASPNVASLGLAIMCVGFGMRWSAICTLGDAFCTELVAPPRRIECGLYRWLDHPAEFGMTAIAVGAPLALGANVVAISVCLLLLPIVRWRIRQENRMFST